jgi:hypothetical protein
MTAFQVVPENKTLKNRLHGVAMRDPEGNEFDIN